MNIGFIAAMPEEAKAIIDKYKLEVKSKINNQDVYHFSQPGLNTYIFTCGIGKTNAAITTSLAISELKLDLIINIGTAGALDNGLAIGDYVLAQKLAFYDVDATGFGYELGQIPQEKLFLELDNTKLMNLLESANIPFKSGLIISGDSFITAKNINKIPVVLKEEALAVEMESMAIALAARKAGIPCFVVRTISDQAGSNAPSEFDKYLLDVMQKYSQLFDLIVKNYGKLK